MTVKRFRNLTNPGPGVIFFMPNSAEHEISTAHKKFNATK